MIGFIAAASQISAISRSWEQNARNAVAQDMQDIMNWQPGQPIRARQREMTRADLGLPEPNYSFWLGANA